MAKETGLGVATVKRSIIRLADLGIIQSWAKGYSACTYLLNEFFKQKKIMAMFKVYFIGFFAISALSSGINRELVLTLNELNLLKSTGTNIVLSNNIAAQDLYLPDSAWLYRSEKGVPNKKITFEQFEAQFFKQEQYMNNFTQDQLLQLVHYPKETLSYATKMLTKDMAAGKEITNQFAYFKSICERAKIKTPQTGSVKPTTRPTTGAQSIYKHEEREQESDYVFARNLELKLHERRNDETLHKAVFRVENPKWKRITVEEQQQIMTDIHQDCNCRQLVDRSLHEESVVDKKETTEPVGMNWNSLVQAKPEVPVSDNIPDFMSEQHLGEEYGEFQEVLD